jgi:hypothetical protein
MVFLKPLSMGPSNSCSLKGGSSKSCSLNGGFLNPLVIERVSWNPCSLKRVPEIPVHGPGLWKQNTSPVLSWKLCCRLISKNSLLGNIMSPVLCMAVYLLNNTRTRVQGNPQSAPRHLLQEGLSGNLWEGLSCYERTLRTRVQGDPLNKGARKPSKQGCKKTL